jgi:hypothetical protein
MSKPKFPHQLAYSYNPDEDVMTIEGLRFGGQFFRDFARDIPLNAPLKIVSRDDGHIVIDLIEPGDPDWAGSTNSARIIPPDMIAFMVPKDAPKELTAEALRSLADQMDSDDQPAVDQAPKVILPPGHA